MERVTMTHSSSDGATREVSREAFDRVWSGKGWTIAGDGVPHPVSVFDDDPEHDDSE